MPTQTVTLAGHLQPEQEKSYVHLPFDMPPHATRLKVSYAYSQRIGADPFLSGGNTLDLGVFDSRGIDFLRAGFRGWSGSERESFFITNESATPGYLHGPLGAGRWHVALGLYKIAATGCDYRVTLNIETNPAQQSPTELPRVPTRLPYTKPRARSSPWLRGELHCHTLHSDGDGTVREVVALARERGLDFLAITDHNTLSHRFDQLALTDPGLILIPGVEVTTYKGHWNAWGIGEWIDFRVTRAEEMTRAIQFAVERGALTSCCHPKPFGPAWECEDIGALHCVEVWNGPWAMLNDASLEFWVARLANGQRLVAVGGSDYHRRAEMEGDLPRAPGTPTTWVYVPGEASADAILDAMRAGHVCVSDSPDGAFVELRAGDEFRARGGDALPRARGENLRVRVQCERGAGNALRLLDQERILFARTIKDSAETLEVELDVSNSVYVRAELRAANEDMKALTNPIYLVDARA